MKLSKMLSLLLAVAIIVCAAPLHIQAAPEESNADTLPPVEADIITDAEEESDIVPTTDEEGDISSATDEEADISSATDEEADIIPATEEETPPVGTGEENHEYVRTIMMYICGSNLETYGGMATYNIRQILKSNFSAEDKVKFIIMTGGSDEWHTPPELLADPSDPDKTVYIDPEYNQIWEAKGADAAENPGKMVLLEEEGLYGEKARDRDGEDDEEFRGEMMSDPKLLKGFIDYCAENYPAQKYDLILWDHGSGPLGGFANDEGAFLAEMTFGKMMDAFSDNAVTRNGGKFDFINFDACLMGSADFVVAFADYMNYYIASPELIPGYGQYYTNWLNLLGEQPDYDTFELGKKIVDDYIEFYSSDEDVSDEGTLAVIDVDELTNYYGFVETLKNLPYYLREQATKKDSELKDYLFYDEFDSVKNSIRYGGENYYDLGTLYSQLTFDFKELAPSDLIGDDEVIDENIYTEPLAQLAYLLYESKAIYARGTKGIKSVPLYHRDIYGKTDYSSVGTSGMYLYFPTADKVRDTINYYSAVKPVIEKLEEIKGALNPTDKDKKLRVENRIKFLDDYRHALIEYALISKMGYSVTRMLDEGYERSSINYDSLRNYFTGGAVYDPSITDLEDPANYDYLLSDWNMEFIEYMLRRENLEDSFDFSQHAAAEAASRDWLSGIIEQQAEENISRKDMRLLKTKDGGFRVRMKNTQKRVVEDIRYNITARIPAAEDYIKKLQAEGELGLMTDEEYEDFTTAKIGHISGNAVLEKANGTAVNKRSNHDYLNWYMEPGGTWELPHLEESWYTVQDANGYCHVANIETDEEAGEIYFYGNYKSANGIDTLCCLSFDANGNLESILLGTEDGSSYRRIPASEIIGEVEVMPIRSARVFVDDVSIPLSKKPILVSKETASSIKLVKKDLNDIEDLKSGGKAEVMRNIVVRDIYGYEIPFTEEEAEELAITYDLNGGKYAGSADKIIENYPYGADISIREAPVRKGYKFVYWKGSEYHPGDSYKVTDDHTFIAQWERTDKGSEDSDSSDNPGSKDEPDRINKPTERSDSDKADRLPGAKTGDSNDLSLMIIMLIISAAALAVTIGRRIVKR